MKSNKLWATTAQVCAACSISRTVLMTLKKTDHLIAGKHWVHPSGKRHSPIGWNLDAVKSWQIQRAEELAKEPAKFAAAIEYFEVMGG